MELRSPPSPAKSNNELIVIDRPYLARSHLQPELEQTPIATSCFSRHNLPQRPHQPCARFPSQAPLPFPPPHPPKRHRPCHVAAKTGVLVPGSDRLACSLGRANATTSTQHGGDNPSEGMVRFSWQSTREIWP